MVDGDAVWGAYGILTAVALADGIFFVILASEVETQAMLYLACLLSQTVLLNQRQHSAFHRCYGCREVQHCATVAVAEILVFVATAEHAEEHTVHTY